MAAQPPKPAFTVVVYTKPGCHLCDDLLGILYPLRDSFEFAISERNIEEDGAIFDRYQYLIPVMELPGGKQLFPPHDPNRVRETLAAAVRTVDHD